MLLIWLATISRHFFWLLLVCFGSSSVIYHSWFICFSVSFIDLQIPTRKLYQHVVDVTPVFTNLA